MATLVTLTQRLRDTVYSARPAERPFTQRLAVGYTDVATTIAVPNGPDWEEGDVLENLATGEQVWVVSVAVNTLTVVRSFNGTTAAAGTTGDYVAKNPRYTAQQLEANLTAAINDLSSHGVFRFATTTFTLISATTLYNLALDDLYRPPGVLGVYIIDPSYDTPEPLPFRLHTRIHADLAAAEEAIELPAWWGSGQAGDTVYVLATHNVTDPSHLTVPQEQIVVDGAAAEALLSSVVARTHDPGHQTDRTVQPGQTGRDARFFQAKHLTAVHREAARLSVEVQDLQTSYGTIRSNRARRFRR